ncbi:MAG: hypothetical protein OJF49_002229 [Ktedonobacterales bacterium]|jgi:hypothetical protein|nr:MAG: hypothetical protein OJF49_002229 [Ktedonobacterales bacterium]
MDIPSDPWADARQHKSTARARITRPLPPLPDEQINDDNFALPRTWFRWEDAAPPPLDRSHFTSASAWEFDGPPSRDQSLPTSAWIDDRPPAPRERNPRTKVLTKPLQTESYPYRVTGQPTYRRAPVSRPQQRSPRANRGARRLFFVVATVSVALSVAAAMSLGDLLPSIQPSANIAGPARPLPTATPTETPPLPTATPLPVTGATFLHQDTTTQGAWQGVYGQQGALVVADTQQLSDAFEVVQSGATELTWAATSADARATQTVSNPANRIAACWYSQTTFTLDVTILDGQSHQLAVYLLDWDQQHRAETITVNDPATHAVLDTQTFSNFASGVYAIWTIRGHVTLQITNATGSINAVVSGIFIDPA